MLSVSRHAGQAGSIVSERGAIIPLAAFVLAVIILLAGFIVWLMSLGAAMEQTRGSIKLIALAAVQEYYAYSCPSAQNVESCHGSKLAAALTRARAIAAANANQLGTLQFGTGNAPPEAARVEGVYYYATRPPQEQGNPCPQAYPCTQVRQPNTLANAINIKGKATDSLAIKLSKTLGYSFGDGVEFDVTATAVPIHAVYVIDISSSIAEGTHLAADAVNEKGELVAKHSHFAFPLVPLTGKEEEEDPGHKYSANPEGYKIADEVWDVWKVLGEAPSPRSSDKNPARHYWDDYRNIEVVACDVEGRSSISPELAARHPSPGDGGTIYSGEPGPTNYKLDLYRDAGIYDGAQPYLAVLQGVKGALRLLADRKVAGDKASLVFYDSTLLWNRVFNLTDDLAYLDSVLDIDSITDADTIQANLVAYQDYDDIFRLGPLLAFNLFPTPLTYTNTLLAFTEAVRQLSTEGGLYPSGQGGVPAVNTVVHISDGLLNCSIQLQNCDANSHAMYTQAMGELKQLVYNSLFRSRITLHMLMAGSQGGPHTLALGAVKDKENGSTECINDEEARKLGVDFVRGTTFADPFQAQVAWDNRATNPVYAVSKDWYDLTVMTGGIWAPIRSSPAGCQPFDGSCDPDPQAAQRITVDPECRTVNQQVDDYLGQVLKDSRAYVVVE